MQAKWQRNSKHLPGVYAVRVQGQLPQDIIDDLEARGIKVNPNKEFHSMRSWHLTLMVAAFTGSLARDGRLSSTFARQGGGGGTQGADWAGLARVVL